MQRTGLETAVQAGIITGAQADSLASFYAVRPGGLRAMLRAALRELIEARARP